MFFPYFSFQIFNFFKNPFKTTCTFICIITTSRNSINKILDTYKNISIEKNKKINLVNFTFELKNTNNLPAIIFNNDTDECLLMVKKYSEQIDRMKAGLIPNLNDLGAVAAAKATIAKYGDEE